MRYIASLCFHYDSANGSKLQFASISYFFSFRPTPSCLLFLSCEPQIIPRPQVGGRADRYQFAVAGDDTIRSLLAAPVRSLTLFVRYCPFLSFSACFRSFPLAFAHLRRSAFRPAARYEKRGEDFVSPVPRSPPASIDIGKSGRGCRIAGLSPSRLFCLSCLLAAFSFPYKPGMVMGYSVATVIYFS